MVCRKIGISEQTYYLWRREYDGMKVAQARRLKELEKENARLKRHPPALGAQYGVVRTAGTPLKQLSIFPSGFVRLHV